jgi:hypothetical protein
VEREIFLAPGAQRHHDEDVHRRSHDEKRYEIVEARERAFEARDEAPFDRIAFALATLDRLRPKNLKVVVYPNGSELNIERGSELGGRQWAIVGIPSHASRAYIAFRLAELAGRADIPFVIDSLLAPRHA